jgi:hypothetical protein
VLLLPQLLLLQAKQVQLATRGDTSKVLPVKLAAAAIAAGSGSGSSSSSSSSSIFSNSCGQACWSLGSPTAAGLLLRPVAVQRQLQRNCHTHLGGFYLLNGQLALSLGNLQQPDRVSNCQNMLLAHQLWC